MAEEKVYTQETIENTDFPDSEEYSFSTSQSTSNDIYSNVVVDEQPMPTRKIAHEVISSALNTKSKKILQEFQFTQTGAIQIGEYENGLTGDIKISPTGILGRNSSGQTTFAIDAETGDATFAGLIQSGSLITGLLAVGDNSVIIDGESKRIVINDGDNDIILIGKQIGGF